MSEFQFGTEVRDRVHGLRGVLTGYLAQIETLEDGRIIRHVLEVDRLEPVLVPETNVTPTTPEPEKPVLLKKPVVRSAKTVKTKKPVKITKTVQSVKTGGAQRSGSERGELRNLAVGLIAKSKTPMSVKEVSYILLRDSLANQKLRNQIRSSKITVERLVRATLENASAVSDSFVTDEPKIKKVAPGKYALR